MLFIANVFEPLQQKCFGIFGAMRALGAVFQVVHEATKFMEAADRTCAQATAQAVGKQGFKQTQFVLTGQGTQARQGLVTNAAFGTGDCAQKRRVVIVVDPQAKPRTQIFNFSAVKETLTTRNFVRNLGAP